MRRYLLKTKLLIVRNIKEKGKGSCRIHGNGFGGTIQVFLPEHLIEEYKAFVSKIFKRDSVKVLSIRNLGAVCSDNIQQ